MKKKRRILIDNLFVRRGGVEVMMWSVISKLIEQGYDVTLAAAYWHGIREPGLIPHGVHFIKRYIRQGHYKKFTPRWFANKVYYRVYGSLVSFFLSILNFDLVVSMQEKWTMKRTDKLRAKRKIAWVHTDYSTRINPEKGAFPSPAEEKACMQRFEKVICVSETVKNGLIQTVGDPGNLFVAYNPINVEEIRAKAQSPCPLEKNRDKSLLISVGRLVAEKQYLMLLQACEPLWKTFDFDLWIIGEGEERKLLEAYIAEKHLKNVRLLGHQDNPFCYMRQADLFVSSSCTEGNPLAVQEALVLGLPLVAAHCPAVAEIFDPKYGLLVGNSAAELEAGIKKILLDPKLLAEYRKNISNNINKEELYDHRLDRICSLLENKIL